MKFEKSTGMILRKLAVVKKDIKFTMSIYIFEFRDGDLEKDGEYQRIN